MRPSPSSEPSRGVPSAGRLDGEKTLDLLDRVRAGDEDALACLFNRYIAPLRRWAHGRLPRWARELRDTDDLVQESVMQTLRHIREFQPQHDGAFHAYLRRVLHNRLVDEIRRVGRAPRDPLADDQPDRSPSPLEEVIGRDALARYEEALAKLRPDEREAVVARIELGCSYLEIAQSLGKASPDAARMVVSRALVRLAREMKDGR